MANVRLKNYAQLIQRQEDMLNCSAHGILRFFSCGYLRHATQKVMEAITGLNVRLEADDMTSTQLV